MRRLVFLLLAAGCASHPPKTGTGTGTGTGSEVARTVDAGAAAPAPAPLTADECTRMIDHIVDLTLADKKAKEPDKVWTDEKVAAARQTLHDEMMPQCVGAERSPFDCIMAATTIDQVAPCVSE